MNLQELEAIAKWEFLRHGLHDWSFGWARTKRRQGVCKYRSKRIEIAEYYATHNPPEQVIDTLLHEIAHALAGPKARHGPAWKAVAKKLGATPRAYDTCRETVVMPGVRVPASSRLMGRLPLYAYRDRPLKNWSLFTIAPV